MLFWSSVSLCTRAAIQLRNDSSCSNLTHTEDLNLISSGKFNDSCLLSSVGLICFSQNVQKLDLLLSVPGHSYFYYLSRFLWFVRNLSALSKKTLSNRLS